MTAFLALVVAGLGIWAHRVNAVMPGIIDEALYIWQAERLAEGHVTDPAPAHPEFVSMPFAEPRNGRRFAQYPLGFPLALVPWILVGFPWALNILLGAGSLLLLFRFARRIDGAPVAWIAMLLTALSPFFIAQSTIFLSHPLTLFLTLVLLVAVARWRDEPARARWPLAAGLATGYAFNVSPFVAAPMLAVTAERWLATRDRAARRLRPAVWFFAAFTLGPLGFALANFAATGDPLRPAYYAFPEVRAGFGPNAGPRGHSLAIALDHARIQILELNHFLFGWKGSSFIFVFAYGVIAAARAIRRRTRSEQHRPDSGSPSGDTWDRPLAILLASTVVVYLFWYFAGTGKTWGPRYLYATLPALAIFSARGVAGVASHLGAWAARARPAWRAAAVAAPAVSLVALTLTGTVPFLSSLANEQLIQRRRASRALLDTIERAGIRDATVFLQTDDKNTFQSSLLYASGFRDDTSLVFALDLGPEKNARLIEARPDAPVYYAWTASAVPKWEFRDRPFERRQAAPAHRPGALNRRAPNAGAGVRTDSLP